MEPIVLSEHDVMLLEKQGFTLEKRADTPEGYSIKLAQSKDVYLPEKVFERIKQAEVDKQERVAKHGLTSDGKQWVIGNKGNIWIEESDELREFCEFKQISLADLTALLI